MKQNPKTEQQVDDEIEALKLLREKPHDKDWTERINSQLDVLENDLNRDEIHARFDQPGQGEITLCFALFARDWLDGTANLITLLREIGYIQGLTEMETEYKLEFETEFNDEK